MGMGRWVGIPETVVLTSAALFEATVTAAVAPELAPVASVLELPATFEATAASSDTADWVLEVAWEDSSVAVDAATGVSAMMWTGEGVYVPSGIDALAGIWTVVV